MLYRSAMIFHRVVQSLVSSSLLQDMFLHHFSEMLDELHAASDMTILLDDELMSRATSYTHILDNDPKTIWTTYLETLIQGGISMVGWREIHAPLFAELETAHMATTKPRMRRICLLHTSSTGCFWCMAKRPIVLPRKSPKIQTAPPPLPPSTVRSNLMAHFTSMVVG